MSWVDGLGDLTGDGLADLVYGTQGGAQHLVPGQPWTGSSYEHLPFLWSGPWALEGAAAAGDLDDDGDGDAWLLASNSDLDLLLLRVWGGDSSEDWDVVELRRWPGVTSQVVSVSVETVGDVDGDGSPDVAVSASGTDLDLHGWVEVFSASGQLLCRIESLPDGEGGSMRTSSLGWSLAGVGDMDGDQQVDLAIGSGLEAVYLASFHTL